MRTALLIGAASLGALGSQAGAQAPVRAATLADSAVVEHNIYIIDFHNIALSPEQSATARNVIARTERAARAVRFSPTAPCEHYNQVARLIASRDSTLLALMRTRVDSAKFMSNAAQFHMSPCAPPKK